MTKLKKGKTMAAKKPNRTVTTKRTTKKSVKNTNFLTRLSTQKLTAIAFVIMFAGIGSYMLFRSYAAPGPIRPFVDNPARGLVWAGLKTPHAGSVCDHLYEVVNEHAEILQCTHGPDPAPEGVDVRKSVEPVRTGEDDITASATTTTGSTTAAASLIPCDGDGTTGNRIQALYVHASDVPSRYATYATSFQTWAGNTNNVFVESGLQTGEARNLRWVHDVNCNVVVADVTLPVTGDDSYSNTVTELQKLGYNRTDRKYLLWVDATVYCGLGSIRGDDQPGSGNANNGGSSYARVDSGCWGSSYPVEAHELMHNLGGVQLSAPHTTGAWHCTDSYDRECYADASGVVMTYPCPSTESKHFDCNKDDYFYAGTPPAGNYLSTHWNAANSTFLIKGGGTTTVPVQCNNGVDDDADGKADYPNDPGCAALTDDSEAPDPATPPPADTTAPTVTIASPNNGVTVSRTVNIAATATDNIGVVKMQIYVDGILKATSTTNTISYSWNSRKASSGTHTITVKAFDAAGNGPGQASVSVTK